METEEERKAREKSEKESVERAVQFKYAKWAVALALVLLYGRLWPCIASSELTGATHGHGGWYCPSL
ncbi:hypothetical protein [Variovorax rhizosphaerae]|uniref:Uncharacterized protein n=1 Tax=Variovorax rhizosphaerae TaxID=1836200 RepID=A0ABU8WPN7_9BURK